MGADDFLTCFHLLPRKEGSLRAHTQTHVRLTACRVSKLSNPASEQSVPHRWISSPLLFHETSILLSLSPKTIA